MRRNQARQAHRKYTDEVGFVVGKDSATRCGVRRRMRDFFDPGRGAPSPPPRRWPPPSRRSSPTPPGPSACGRRRRAEAHQRAARQGVALAPELKAGNRSGQGRPRGTSAAACPLLDSVRALLTQATSCYGRSRPRARAPPPGRCSTGWTSRCGWPSPARSRRASRRCSTPWWARSWRPPARASAPASSPGTATASPTGPRCPPAGPPGALHPRRRGHRRRPRRSTPTTCAGS